MSAVAASLTPFGPGVWAYALGLSVNPAVTARITEWQPTSLRDVPGIVFFASALGVAALIARRGRATSWPTLAWLAVFFLIGAYAIRGVAWWPLGAVVAISGMFAANSDPGAAPRPEPLGTPAMRRLNLGVVGALILVGVLLLPVWRATDPAIGAPARVVGDAPAGITAALRQLARPGDRLFDPQPWGSWFEFALPDLPVAIDSRIELFPIDVWHAYEGIVAGTDGWQVELHDWGVTIVVVRDQDADLARRLTAAGWNAVYTDLDGSVFVAADR